MSSIIRTGTNRNPSIETRNTLQYMPAIAAFFGGLLIGMRELIAVLAGYLVRRFVLLG